VLKNKLGIQNQEKFWEVERKLTAIRINYERFFDEKEQKKICGVMFVCLIIRANSKQHISKFHRTTMPKLAVGRAVAEHPLLCLQVCLFAISSVYGT